MQHHKFIHNKSTYPNIDDVEKYAYATSNQALNQTLTAKCIVNLKPLCGRLKKPHITKRRKDKKEFLPLKEGDPTHTSYGAGSPTYTPLGELL